LAFKKSLLSLVIAVINDVRHLLLKIRKDRWPYRV